MPLDFHSLELADGSSLTSRTDRLIICFLPNVANAAGAEGAAVNVAVSGLSLPSTYGVQVEPSQAVVTSMTNKTFGGFTVTLTPLSSTQTIAAGNLDIWVTA
jgi:hypothetical protein